MSTAAVVLKQNRIMRRFAEAGATSPATAMTPEEIGCRQGWIFRHMEAKGVFVSVGEGRFYLDELAAESFRRRRRNRVLIIALGAILLAFLAWLAMKH